MAKPASIEGSVRLQLAIPPFGAISGGISGTWEPDEKERQAAWEMYVELVTRISVAELAPEEGLLREALSSLYSLFGTTREILRKYGPTVAKPKRDGDLSFGQLAIFILNNLLRPVLAKWHPVLADYESSREPSVGRVEHEREWQRNAELRQVLAELRVILAIYGATLAEVAGVPALAREH